MVSFAEVEANLQDDEKILWKKQVNTNELKELRFTLNIFILTVGASLFTILIYFFTIFPQFRAIFNDSII